MFDQQSVNKLIVLYVFDKMDVPLQLNIVVDMVSSNNWINYMECSSIMQDLIKSSFIANMATKSSTPRYAITADGRECLNLFYTNINSSLRDSIAENIRKNRMTYRKKQDYPSDYYKNADGTYTVILKIESTSLTLFELKLNVQTKKTAKAIHQNWGNNAAMIYELIHEHLIEL